MAGFPTLALALWELSLRERGCIVPKRKRPRGRPRSAPVPSLLFGPTPRRRGRPGRYPYAALLRFIERRREDALAAGRQLRRGAVLAEWVAEILELTDPVNHRRLQALRSSYQEGEGRSPSGALRAALLRVDGPRLRRLEQALTHAANLRDSRG